MLSTITPLAPPATLVCPTVVVLMVRFAPLSTLKDMIQPEFAGHEMGVAVWPLACTLVKIQSFAVLGGFVPGL